MKDFSKRHGAKEAWRLLAGEGIVSVVADKRLEVKQQQNNVLELKIQPQTSNCESHLLVEDGPVSAEEAVLGSACHDSIVVLDRQADVEDLDRGYLFYQS